MQRTGCSSFTAIFLRSPFHFPSFLNTVDPCVLRIEMEVGDSRHQAFSRAGSFQLNLHFQGRRAWGYLPPAPGTANPRFPRAGLISRPCHQPSQARTGPSRPALPQQPLEPSQWGWAWAPAATAPPTRAPNGRCAPPVTLAPDLPARECGTPGQRPRAAGRAPRRPRFLPGTPSIPGGAGRGKRPGGCHKPERPGARVAGTWLSP